MLGALKRALHRWDIDGRIRRRGWTGIYVGDYRHAPSWAYTIGLLVTLGAPEIIVFDLPKPVADALLGEVFRQLKDGELVIRDGETWGDGDKPAAWRRVHPSQLANDEHPWLGLAETFDAILMVRPREFEAFQLVLSDGQGCFPWDAGYDERLRPLQPELYLPLEEAPPEGGAAR